MTALQKLQDYSDATTALVAETARHVVGVTARDHGGSIGIVVGRGVIAPGEEPVERDADTTIRLADGSDAPSTLVGSDPTTGIAVLRYDAGADAPAGLAAAPDPVPGALAIAVGRGEVGVVAASGI